MWSSVEHAVAVFRAGEPVVVVDDESRENEGDLIAAAQYMTAERMAFVVRHSSGLVCAAMDSARLGALQLPLMYPAGKDRQGTAFAVSTDLRDGVTTGISATDRAATVRALADPSSIPRHFSRPGHVLPLHAATGGVLERPGHTEAAVDLATMAGLHRAAVLAEIVNDDGSMAGRPDLERFAQEHRLPLISVADLVSHRRRTERLVRSGVVTVLPTSYGAFQARTYVSDIDGAEHLALVLGDVRDRSGVLVRVHCECLTGDVFGSKACDCAAQLDAAQGRIARAGHGVVVYLRDPRDYFIAAQILTDLGVCSVRLMTSNADRVAQLTDIGVRVDRREPLLREPLPDSADHLRGHRDRLGTQFDSRAIVLAPSQAIT